MKKYLILLIILIPLLSGCGAGGGAVSDTGNSGGDNGTGNKTNPLCSSKNGTVRIKIKEDGIFRVAYEDLYDACFNLQDAELSTFKLTNQGSEIAVEIVDANQNGSFDAGDYVEFYGKAIPRGDNRFRYTETNVYWLSTESGPRKRIHILSPPASQLPNPETSFKKVIHMEEDTWYEQKNYPEVTSPDQIREHWFWGEVFYTPGLAGEAKEYYIRDYSFSTPYVDKTVSALMKIRLQSVSGTHHVKGYINSKLVLDRLDPDWSGQKTLDVEVSFPASYLNNGPNIFRLESVGDTEAGIYEVFYLDWFEIHYYHTYHVEHNLLEFTGNALITLSNFTTSADISIYEISDPSNIKKIIPSKIERVSSVYQVLFSSPSDTGGRFLALSSSGKKAPFDIEGYAASDLRSTKANYIIIVHEDFLDAIAPLADYRRSNAGGSHDVLTVKMRDVYDEFSDGIETPRAIREFLAHAYGNRDNQPAFVLLVGDATIDYKDISGYGKGYGVKSYVPAYLYNYPALGEVPSDNWFVDVSGDKMPEMHIGRIPAKTAGEVSAVINKIMAHETSSFKSSDISLIADYDLVSGTIFEDMSDSLASLFTTEYNVSKLYQRDYIGRDDFHDDIISAIDYGPLIINYTGHGSVTDWTKENILTSKDITLLKNTGYPFVVSMNCLNGYFVLPDDGVSHGGVIQPPSIAEAFLMPPEKGAVAVLAASSIGYPSEHDPLAKALYEVIVGQDVTLGETVTNAKMAAYYNGDILDDVVQTFIFFGDPATRLK